MSGQIRATALPPIVFCIFIVFCTQFCTANAQFNCSTIDYPLSICDLNCTSIDPTSQTCIIANQVLPVTPGTFFSGQGSLIFSNVTFNIECAAENEGCRLKPFIVNVSNGMLWLTNRSQIIGPSVLLQSESMQIDLGSTINADAQATLLSASGTNGNGGCKFIESTIHFEFIVLYAYFLTDFWFQQPTAV
jgi:hypothetical protein